MMDKEHYPIGNYNCPSPILNKHLEIWKTILTEFPEKLEALVKDLNEEQLDTTYREDGWTIRKVVHH